MTTSADGNIRRRNKALIFRHAKAEFVQYGFKGASIKRIAERAELPRANIHYYFKNKEDLYLQLLSEVLSQWNENYTRFGVDDDPKEALGNYIRDKVMYSKEDPDGSRLFASEIIHGAPHLQHYLQHQFKDFVKAKVAVLEHWQADGKIKAGVDPLHLLFMIWSSTQHYADFSVQVLAAMDKPQMTEEDFDSVVESLTSVILGGVLK